MLLFPKWLLHKRGVVSSFAQQLMLTGLTWYLCTRLFNSIKVHWLVEEVAALQS